MATKSKLELDPTTKIIVIIFLAVITYVLSLEMFTPILAPQYIPRSGKGALRFVDPYANTAATTISFIPSSIVGIIAALKIKTKHPKPKLPKGLREVNEYRVLKRALSDDEKRIYDEIRRAKKITQSSLRFRLDWNKAKVSRILTNLDKMNLIQRERVGKTYNVFLQKRRR